MTQILGLPVSEPFEQKRLLLSDLGYVMDEGESRRHFANVVTGYGNDGDPNKALRFAKAMDRGAKFHPIIVSLLDGKLYLQDGHSRVIAAALCRADRINAVVFNVVSFREADLVLDTAHEHSNAGVPWTESVRRIAAALRLMSEEPAKGG